MATLLSVNVGMPKDVRWNGRTVHTGAWKAPVEGPRTVRRLNIDGDGQGDLGGHGGEQRAVLVYQAQSYDHWREFLGRPDLEFGMFGENLTVDGLPDDEVCIGDRYRIGGAEFEVTQPRVTCYRVGMRLGEPTMAALLVSHRRPGFYCRVLTEGRVRAGDAITRVRRGPGALSVADTDALLYLPGRDPAKLRTALAVDALSPGWRQSFKELADEADRPEAGEGRADTGPGWQGFRPLRVTRIVPESDTVASISLADPDGGPLPAARAGQYLTVRVPGDAPGTPARVRSYSLSSAPGADHYRISVKREPHGQVSGYLHTRLRPGATVEAAAPRGEFVLDDEGTRPVVLVSAGVGATPVLAMLHALAAHRAARPVWWVHAARGPAQHAFAAEAHALLADLPDGHEHVFHTAPPDPDTPAPPAVIRGRPTAEALAGLGLPPDGDAYLCGPVPFMDDVHAALEGLGLPAERIHTEVFGALGAINPGVTGAAAPTAPHRPSGPEGTGPRITFVRSGLATRWSPRYASLLELAEDCGIPTRWSCRTGVCHTCVTPLMSGQARYAPEPLEPPADGEVLICCAHPGGDLLLDL